MHVEGSAPYPWPYDGRLDGAHLALVLAGWDEQWSGRAFDSVAVGGRCVGLAAAVSGFGGLVIGIAHRGHVSLAVPGLGSSLASDGIDAFHGGPLDDVLRRGRRTHLLIAGLGLEGPVHSTLRSANDRGYECLLVADAAAALTPTLADAACKTVTMSGGIFGAVGTTAAVLAAITPTLIPTLAKET
ncbi:MAG: isochorismatase family protein [Microthrixaceae bacterium]